MYFSIVIVSTSQCSYRWALMKYFISIIVCFITNSCWFICDPIFLNAEMCIIKCNKICKFAIRVLFTQSFKSHFSPPFNGCNSSCVCNCQKTVCFYWGLIFDPVWCARVFRWSLNGCKQNDLKWWGFQLAIYWRVHPLNGLVWLWRNTHKQLCASLSYNELNILLNVHNCLYETLFCKSSHKYI